MNPWHGFVDDLREVDAPPLDSPYVGLRAVRDTDLPALEPGGLPVRVVLTGGAAQLAGPVSLCERRRLTMGALQTALRDPADLAGNARRVVAAYWAAGLPDETLLHVRVPGPWSPAVPAALDVLAEVEAVVVALGPEQHTDGHWPDEVMRREMRLSLAGGTAAQAVDTVRLAATLMDDEGGLSTGRRLITSWLTEDPRAAIHHLEELA